MNQILLTKKLYITPELRRKQAFYKFFFFCCVFSIGVLFSFYIYGMYEQNLNEDISREIFTSVSLDASLAPTVTDNVLVVYLNEEIDEEEEPEIITIEPVEEPENVPLLSTYTAKNGKEYNICGLLSIPAIDLNYPILDDTNDDLLKISVCRYQGEPNTVGNLCIAGHNYTNTRAFSNLNKIEMGDIVEITDLSGETIQYQVIDHYIVSPYDLSCTSQRTNGKREVTLITCTNGNSQRRIVKATEVIDEAEAYNKAMEDANEDN